MASFVVGVVSALVASALLAVMGWVAAPRTRRIVIHRLARLTGCDVEEVFSGQSAANDELRRELMRARHVDVFAGRGYEFLREAFAPLWENSLKYDYIRILLPDPEKASPGTWFSDREEEVASYDPAYSKGLLVQQVTANLAFLAQQAERSPKIEVRAYDFPHLCRVVITDRATFLTPYTATAHGRDSSTVLIRPPGPMHDLSARIFQKAWLSARATRQPID